MERAIREPGHPRTAVIYVIDRDTERSVEPFLCWVRSTKLPVIGVMFYFHTPYYGRDRLFLTAEERAPVALRMRFTGHVGGWWWLYWRFYDTRVPLAPPGDVLGSDSRKARRWLSAIEHAGLAHREDGYLELTDPGAFWLHLVQNHFALAYVNTLWTAARREAWPPAIAV